MLEKILLPHYNVCLEECLRKTYSVKDVENYILTLKEQGDRLILSGSSKKVAIDGGLLQQKFFNNFGEQNCHEIMRGIFGIYFKDSSRIMYKYNSEKNRIYFFAA